MFISYTAKGKNKTLSTDDVSSKSKNQMLRFFKHKMTIGQTKKGVSHVSDTFVFVLPMLFT